MREGKETAWGEDNIKIDISKIRLKDMYWWIGVVWPGVGIGGGLL
jgi:hypothetical protein